MCAAPPVAVAHEELPGENTMIFFLALIPATMLTIAGYAMIYLANRSEGGLRTFGKYLAFWAFTLAALVLLGSFLCAARGGGRMHGMMMHGYAGDVPPWHPPLPAPDAQGVPVPPAAAPSPGVASPK